MFNCLSGLELIHENKQLCHEATILTTVNVAAKIRQEAHIKATNMLKNTFNLRKLQLAVIRITNVITCRAKLLNADWLRRGHFFLNQEGTFGNQEGMIT